MERSVLTISAANFITVNLMVIVGGFVLMALLGMMKGKNGG